MPPSAPMPHAPASGDQGHGTPGGHHCLILQKLMRDDTFGVGRLARVHFLFVVSLYNLELLFKLFRPLFAL